MRKIPIVQIDAFAQRPFGGNPAAVVLDATGLSDDMMQAIAKEMNLSETAFLTQPATPGADYRLRWFTPGGEVTFCGHATVATGRALYEAGAFSADRIVFETLGGTLGLARTGEIFWLEPEPRHITAFTGALDEVLAALKLAPSDVADWAAPALSHEHDLLLPCKNLDVLRRSVSSMALTPIAQAAGLRGFTMVTFETVDAASKTHSRFYAPNLGIVEDPVTGSMHASLATWLGGLGLVPDRFTAEQGDLMGRPGRLEIETAGPRVGGRAVTVLSGELLL